MNDAMKTDVLVIGSGLGGLAAAWDAAKRGCAVTLLTRASNPQDSNTYRPLTCVGAYVLDQTTGKIFSILAKETILASGGLGSVLLHTTNPPGARGDGIAMAYRAGARCINLQSL